MSGLERRARYEQAFSTAFPVSLEDAREQILVQVLAVADAEQTELQAEVKRLRAEIDRMEAPNRERDRAALATGKPDGFGEGLGQGWPTLPEATRA